MATVYNNIVRCAGYDNCTIESQTTKIIDDIALGILVGFGGLFVNVYLNLYTIEVLEGMGIEITQDQWVKQLFLKESLLIKVFLTFYGVVIAPILEEYIFRHELHNVLMEMMPENPFTRSLCNGLLFGLAHFDECQGWTNIPIIITLTVVGFIYALLREITGDITASISAHMTNNAVCFIVVWHEYLNQ